MVIENINSSLQAPATVKDVQFSVIRHFPYATLTFKQLEISGYPLVIKDKPFLKADKLDLMLGLWGLFSGNVQLKKMELSGAQLNLITDSKNEHNYKVFKSAQNQNAFTAEFEKIVLRSIELNIENNYSGLLLNHTIDRGLLSGRFSDDQFNLKTSAEVYVHTLQHEKTHYLENKKASLNGVINIDTRNQEYSFEQTDIKIEHLDLNAKGIITTRNDTKLNITISTPKAHAGELFSLLPATWIAPQMLNYHYKGTVYFETTISSTSSNATPIVQIKFGTKQTDIIPDKDDYALKNVSLEGYYTNYFSATKPYSILSLKNIKATLENKPITADIYLENLKNPFMDIAINADVSLASLSRYLPDDFTENQKGNLSFRGTIKGKMDKKETYRSNGTLLLKDIQFKLKKRPLVINNLQGKIVLNDADVSVENLEAHAGQSDIMLNATISNFYNYLFLPNQTLSVKGIVESNYLDIAELLSSNSGSDTGSIDLPSDLFLNASVHAASVKFRKFSATGFEGNVLIKNKILSAQNIRFNAMDGQVIIDGQLNATAKDSLLLSCKANIKKLNIEKLFYETGNFGQQVLTDKQIKGWVTADVDIATMWSKKLVVNQDRIYASAAIVIENGELNNFKPLLKLSRFVKGSDLQQVRFSTLQNNIQIKEQRIIIPSMEIKSSALNLTVNGIHAFSNVVDYQIQLKLSQLLGRKVKELNTEFGTIEQEPNGGLNLFLTMKGPLDNPRFSVDRKRVEKKITDSVKSGKDDFLKILKEEITGRKTEPKEPSKPKTKELQIEVED